jgi:hypothetical protein
MTELLRSRQAAYRYVGEHRMPEDPDRRATRRLVLGLLGWLATILLAAQLLPTNPATRPIEPLNGYTTPAQVTEGDHDGRTDSGSRYISSYTPPAEAHAR